MGVEFEPGAEFAGHQIVAPLGRGGMGVVYHAIHLGLERHVALKVIAADRAVDPDFRERFRREARSAAALDHPGVITIYEAGLVDDLPYMTMRLVRGPDLGRQLRIGGPLEPEVAASVVAMVADALETAHESGLVHRDIKPANILLERRGRELRALLADFGLARLAEVTGLTTTGSWLGTVDYAAPETLAGEPASASADIYALGAVLHAALTGRPPFSRETAAAVIWAHAHEPPPRIAEIEHPAIDALNDVIARAMAKTPAERFSDAGELADAVRAAAGPPHELPLLAQPLALIHELASEITTDPMGASGATETERTPAAAATKPAAGKAKPPPAPAGWATPPPGLAREALPRDATPPSPRPQRRRAALRRLKRPLGARRHRRATLTPAPPRDATPADSVVAPSASAAVPDAAAASPPSDVAGAQPAGVLRRRGRLFAALAGLIVAVVVAAVLLLSQGEVSALDATQLTVDPIPLGDAPRGLVAVDGTPWVLTSTDEEAAVRPIEDDKAGEALTLDDESYALATTGTDLWATGDSGISRIDAAARQVLGGPVDLGVVSSGSRIAAGEGALWVTDTIDNAVIRADETTARPVGDPIGVGGGLLDAIVTGEGAVWVLRSDINSDVTWIVPIDPATNRAGRAIAIDAFTSSEILAVGEGGVWSASEDAERLIRVDPAKRQVDSRRPRFPDGVGDVAAGSGAVWVLDAQGQTVTRVDPRTLKAVGQPIAVAGGSESRLAVTPGATWVLSPSRGAVRITWDG